MKDFNVDVINHPDTHHQYTVKALLTLPVRCSGCLFVAGLRRHCSEVEPLCAVPVCCASTCVVVLEPCLVVCACVDVWAFLISVPELDDFASAVVRQACGSQPFHCLFCLGSLYATRLQWQQQRLCTCPSRVYHCDRVCDRLSVIAVHWLLVLLFCCCG